MRVRDAAAEPPGRWVTFDAVHDLPDVRTNVRRSSLAMGRSISDRAVPFLRSGWYARAFSTRCTDAVRRVSALATLRCASPAFTSVAGVSLGVLGLPVCDSDR